MAYSALVSVIMSETSNSKFINDNNSSFIMIFVSCQTNPARMAQWQRISLVMRRSVVQIRVQAETVWPSG